MNSVKRSSITAISVVILGSTFTLGIPLSAAAQGGPPAQNVNVVNTPLPTTVQGTANISGAVTVNNTSNQPIPVAGPALEPFQALRLANFTSSPITHNFGSPAPGKLLIVEQLSVNVTTDDSAGVAAVVDLEVRQSGALKAVHRIVLTRQDFGSTFAVFLANTPLLAYVNDQQTLQVDCHVTPAPTTSAAPGCLATVAGRLVPAQ